MCNRHAVQSRCAATLCNHAVQCPSATGFIAPGPIDGFAAQPSPRSSRAARPGPPLAARRAGGGEATVGTSIHAIGCCLRPSSRPAAAAYGISSGLERIPPAAAAPGAAGSAVEAEPSPATAHCTWRRHKSSDAATQTGQLRARGETLSFGLKHVPWKGSAASHWQYRSPHNEPQQWWQSRRPARPMLARRGPAAAGWLSALRFERNAPEGAAP